MPTFGLDLMMGRALGFDDVRLDGDELVFTASGSVGAGCRAAYEDGSTFVEIANLVRFPYECPRSTVGESPMGFKDSFEMLSILSPAARPLEPVREDRDAVLSVAHSVGPLFRWAKTADRKLESRCLCGIGRQHCLITPLGFGTLSLDVRETLDSGWGWRKPSLSRTLIMGVNR